MSISEKTKKFIFAKSGNKCAFPGCNENLVFKDSNGKEVIEGELCHIEAKSLGGPRHNRELSEEQMDEDENLILLCANHHIIIDNNPEKYTVACLKDMKKNHEQAISLLSKNTNDKEFSCNYYIAFVDQVSDMLGVDLWHTNLRTVYIGDPHIREEVVNSIERTAQLIGTRAYLGVFPELDEAIKELGVTLDKFLTIFWAHAEFSNGYYRIPKYYHVPNYDQEQYNMLLDDYMKYMTSLYNTFHHVNQVYDKICQIMRDLVVSDYRLYDAILDIEI